MEKQGNSLISQVVSAGVWNGAEGEGGRSSSEKNLQTQRLRWTSGLRFRITARTFAKNSNGSGSKPAPTQVKEPYNMATKVKKKTRKAVTKRFKESGTGKILHKKPGRRHLAACKTRKQKRRLRQTAESTGNIARALADQMHA